MQGEGDRRWGRAGLRARQPAAAGLTAFGLEELLDERGREIMRQLLQDHYSLREEHQARAHPAPVTGADGITRARLETGHGRLLATLFGRVNVTRCAWRKPGAPNCSPADAALSLPAGRHSHILAKLAAIEAARGSFDGAHAAAGTSSASGRSRRPSRAPPPTSPISTPPGSPNRAPGNAAGHVRRLQGHLDAPGSAARCHGEGRREHGKDADPAVGRGEAEPQEDGLPGHRLRRRASEAPPARRHRPAGRPARHPQAPARAKWLAGSVRKDPAEVIAAAFDEAEAGDPAAEDWGAARALAVLAGDSDRAAQEIATEADAAGLEGKQRAGADACVRYLGNKRKFLRHGQAWKPTGRSRPGSSRARAATSLLIELTKTARLIAGGSATLCLDSLLVAADDDDVQDDLARLRVPSAGALTETGDVFDPFRLVDGGGQPRGLRRVASFCVILVDTNVLYALADRRDKHHARCADWLQRTPDVLMVPATVLAETCYLIDRTLGPTAEAAFLDSVGTLAARTRRWSLSASGSGSSPSRR
jgi:hypothetical protein